MIYIFIIRKTSFKVMNDIWISCWVEFYTPRLKLFRDAIILYTYNSQYHLRIVKNGFNLEVHCVSHPMKGFEKIRLSWSYESSNKLFIPIAMLKWVLIIFFKWFQCKIDKKATRGKIHLVCFLCSNWKEKSMLQHFPLSCNKTSLCSLTYNRMKHISLKAVWIYWIYSTLKIRFLLKYKTKRNCNLPSTQQTLTSKRDKFCHLNAIFSMYWMNSKWNMINVESLYNNEWMNFQFWENSIWIFFFNLSSGFALS